MYQRRFSQSIVSSQPNLKNLILINKHRYYFSKYYIILRQKFIDLKNFKGVNKTVQELIKKGKLFQLFADNSTSKDSNVLKVWIHHCECVIAQRLRRCQQMFCLYSKWWEEHALKEFIQKMKQTLARKGKEFALGAVGISSYNWHENRISDEAIKKHSNELDYVNILRKNTICVACDSANKNDSSTMSNSASCKCGNSNKCKTYDDWTLFIQKNDLIVWRRLHPSGQYEYKVYGSYNDVSAEDFLNVQIDTDYRRQWDTTAVVLQVVETDSAPDSNSDIIYWELLWPKLFVNRDYVFNRRYLVDKEDELIYIVSESTQHPDFPKCPEKYRIEDYWSSMVIKPYTEMNQPGIEFSLSYFDNPGVNVPSSVTTWVSIRAMPDFLERLREATKKYKDYCKREGINEVCKVTEKEINEKIQKEQLQHLFKNYKNIKLKSVIHPKTVIEGEISKPSERQNLNTSNVTENSNNSTSDMNSRSSSVIMQPENEYAWFYILHG